MHASFVSGAQRSMSAARRSASSSGAVHCASY